jgi:hypothetical protein
MRRKPIAPKTVLGLIAGALVLPILISVVLAVAALLGTMGDSGGGLVLRYVALGLGIGWSVVLVCLVVAGGLNSLGDNDEGP